MSFAARAQPPRRARRKARRSDLATSGLGGVIGGGAVFSSVGSGTRVRCASWMGAAL